MAKTSIEWSEVSWNPVTGCSKVSPGCAHCYAETIAERFRGTPDHPYEQGFDFQLRPNRLRDPYGWKGNRLVFVNSMSDLFHEDIPLPFLRQVFAAMVATPQHTYQVLTKRSERLAVLAGHLDWAPNIWMGVSVESQRWTARLDDLRQVPAAVRFVSVEPLLGPVDLADWLGWLDWVIVGGESGAGAREMNPAWARALRDQCDARAVPFFFKQWGAWKAGRRVGKKKAGRILDRREHNAMPAAWVGSDG